MAALGSSDAGAITTLSPVHTNMLAAVAARLKEYAASVLKQRKPWTEVVDKNALSKPASIAEAAGRLKKNASYFRVNYLIVMLLTTALTFLMHPSSLFVMALLMGGWGYVFLVRTTPLVINGRTLSEREKLLGMSAVSFITIFFLTSVGTLFFSALSISLAVIVAHGSMREPDNLFLDEGESQQGLLSIFTAPANAGAGSASVV